MYFMHIARPHLFVLSRLLVLVNRLVQVTQTLLAGQVHPVVLVNPVRHALLVVRSVQLVLRVPVNQGDLVRLVDLEAPLVLVPHVRQGHHEGLVNLEDRCHHVDQARKIIVRYHG